jgi:hypothetical protein
METDHEAVPLSPIQQLANSLELLGETALDKDKGIEPHSHPHAFPSPPAGSVRKNLSAQLQEAVTSQPASLEASEPCHIPFQDSAFPASLTQSVSQSSVGGITPSEGSSAVSIALWAALTSRDGRKQGEGVGQGPSPSTPPKSGTPTFAIQPSLLAHEARVRNGLQQTPKSDGVQLPYLVAGIARSDPRSWICGKCKEIGCGNFCHSCGAPASWLSPAKRR